MRLALDKNTHFLIFVFLIQSIALITLILGIPFAQQISNFFFLSFIPGLVLIRLLRINIDEITESVLAAVGLSLAFLMLVGFIVNTLGTVGVLSEPLSTGSLTIILNLVVSAMAVASYFTNRSEFNILSSLSPRRISQSMLFLALPLLSIIGVLFVVYHNSNLLLICTMITIMVLFLVGCFSRKISPYYSIMIFSMALALLLGTTLVSKYMYGSDITLEYNVFKETQALSSLDWSPVFLEQASYKSMLSITLLPTIFSNLMNIDGGWVFKIIFVIFFSLVPVGLYKLFQDYWGKRVAFISTFFFISNFFFYGSLISVTRQMIAELFFVLAFLFIFRDRLRRENERGNFILVGFLVFGLVVSHYATCYIFILLTVGALLFGKLFFRIKTVKIKSTLVALSFCLAFFWYVYFALGPFEKFVGTIRSVFIGLLNEFFYTSARGQEVQTALGLVNSSTFLHDIGTIIYNITSVLLLIGAIALLFKWKKDRRDSEFVLITILSMGLLVSAVVVPRFASFLEVGRLYHIALFFASPLLVLGAKTLFMIVPKLKKQRIMSDKTEFLCFGMISIVLIAFFAFQTGLVYEIADDPYPSSISLSYNKLQNSTNLIFEPDVYSAGWLSNYGATEKIMIFADTLSILRVLTSYSNIERSMLRVLSNSTTISLYPGHYFYVRQIENPDISYVYLRETNVKERYIRYDTKNDINFNLDEVPILNDTEVFLNKIYSNSGSEIYYRIP